MSEENQAQMYQPLFTPAPATASGSGQNVAASATGNKLALTTEAKASYRSADESEKTVQNTGAVTIKSGSSHNQINTGYQSNRSCSIL